MRTVESDYDIANFDLQVSVAEEFDTDGAAAGMTAGIVFATDIFDARTVRGFADRPDGCHDGPHAGGERVGEHRAGRVAG